MTRLDRLARSTFDLFAIVYQIVDATAQFRSPAKPGAEHPHQHWRSMIGVLDGLAEFERERELIRIRTGEGRERACLAYP